MRCPFFHLTEGALERLFRDFARDESGSEMAEFALVLAIFSLAALIGWGAIASAASYRENSMQNNMSSVVVTPP